MPSQILLRRLCRPLPVPSHILFPGPLVRLELLDLLAIHVLHDLIGLPFLEREADAFVRVVFVVGLILVELDADEVRLDRLGVERKADEGVDGGGFGDQAEGPGL